MAPYGELEQQRQVTPIEVAELLRRWPRTVQERLDRILCNFAAWKPSPGASLTISRSELAVAFAESEHELEFALQSLAAQGLVRSQESIEWRYTVSLTAQGWMRVHDLTSIKSSASNPAFVAMWYGAGETRAPMDSLFRDGIEPAVLAAGYKVIRADLGQHNDWIMDKVVADIRIAPFVVADFTGHRGGVYYEAGYARGLGVPVIHTCRSDEFTKAHFNTAQINHVLWSTPEELSRNLLFRIRATVGLGPFVPSEASAGRQ